MEKEAKSAFQKKLLALALTTPEKEAVLVLTTPGKKARSLLLSLVNKASSIPEKEAALNLATLIEQNCQTKSPF